MPGTTERWEEIYGQISLAEVPSHYQGMTGSPFLQHYLLRALQLCPGGSRAVETGIGSGYGSVWLSLRGVQAEGMDLSPRIVERARQVNNVLQGRARFQTGDLFHLYRQWEQHGRESAGRPFQLIHHQGVLEHFTVPQIRSALAQQALLSHWVVFSVPSVYYPFEPEFGDERLLPVEEWRRILEPFEIAELTYYGDPRLGGQEQILCVLKGQGPSAALHSLVDLPGEPYPPGISAIVHTRNEAHQLAQCLETLAGWTDEIIVCDMESSDGTLEIARRFTDQIVQHPYIPNFDRARNVSAMRARYRWVFYLDADERVPAELGRRLREFTETQADSYGALLPPFRHFFSGHWMQCLYPGYTAPRLFRNGKFRFNARLHSGAEVEGPIVHFPAENPALALEHHSFSSFAHYLEKLNRYTDGEAANLHRDGQPFHWQIAVREFVRDYQMYWEGMGAARDGVHGFIYSFASGFYRFWQQAKLFERRARQGQIQPAEQAIPSSLDEVLEFALAVAREKPRPAPLPVRVGSPAPARGAVIGGPSIGEACTAEASIGVVWSGPLLSGSGYGEESRRLLFALDAAGIPVSAHPNLRWGEDALLEEAERRKLEELRERSVAPGFVHVTHDFGPGFSRHPQAGISVGRTLFETDRLPSEWVKACNRMDRVWVATEFNRESFQRSGVTPEKLAVIPECLDPERYQAVIEPEGIAGVLREEERFVFLAVFDWTLHKGWDLLLRAFVEAFAGREDVLLALKAWSTLGYGPEGIRRQAAAFAEGELDHPLLVDPRIVWIDERLSARQMIALYQSCDAYVLPSRGEGWGRPYMEAMACGKPAIATGWSGNTAFMTPENSYLLPCELRAVPERGWREIPTYKGHRWAEPDVEALKAILLRVVEAPEEARSKGARAREDVSTHFNPQVIGELMAAEIRQLIECRKIGSQIGKKTGGAPDGALLTRRNGRTRRHPDGARLTTAEPMPEPIPEPTPEPTSVPAREPIPEPVPVRWEGPQFAWHSLAHVNREMCLGLLETGRVELSVVPSQPALFKPDEEPRFSPLVERMFAPLSRPAAIEFRHQFPPRLTPPEDGHLVVMQAWEYGSLPRQWIPDFLENVTEVWCHSGYVRDVYLRSGIPEERLQVVPHGIDERVFRPDALPYIFTDEPGADRLSALRTRPETRTGPEPGKGRAEGSTERRERGTDRPFTFLFVGGTLHRKGFDILLEAYLRAFAPLDPVCLVVKDTCTGTVYKGQNERERVLETIRDGSRPAIVYLEEDLPAAQLAGIYTACDCLVAPYRGEAFCLPVLEAMGCGLPVVVTAGGPTDDFVDESVGWRVEAQRKPFPGSIGEWRCVEEPWLFEVDVNDLARLLREVAHDPDEAARRGEAAAKRAHEGWTWRHATQKAVERIEALAARPPLRAQAQRSAGADKAVLDRAPTPACSPGPELSEPGDGVVIEVYRGAAARGSASRGRDRQETDAPETDATQTGSRGTDSRDANAWGTDANVNSGTGSHPTEIHGAQASELTGKAGARDHSQDHSQDQARDQAVTPQALMPNARTGRDLRRSGGKPIAVVSAKEVRESVAAGPDHAGSVVQPAKGMSIVAAAGERLVGSLPPDASGTVRAMPRISLCMIVKNEERVLANCLASIRPWVDEMIVVDTGSTDRTRAIAREYGALLFEFPWCDSFSAARNESIRHATGDWIFWMDADDEIPEECGRRLRETVFLAEDRTDGFILQVHFPSRPGETGMTVVDHIKLFRNDPALRWEYRMHEQILGAIHRHGGVICRTPLYVTHSGYDFSPEGQARKRERDLKLLGLDLEERPDDPFVLFNLGMTWFYMGELDKAELWLGRAIAVTEPHESTCRKLYAMMAGCFEQRGILQQAREWLEKGLRLFPRDPELLFRGGKIFEETGDFHAAERCYLQLFEDPERGHIDSIDVSMGTFKGRHNLGLLYRRMGRMAEAEAQLREALRIRPDFTPAATALTDLLLKMGRRDDLLRLAESLEAHDAGLAAEIRRRALLLGL